MSLEGLIAEIGELLQALWNQLGKPNVLQPIFGFLEDPRIPILLSLALLLAAPVIWFGLKLLKFRPLMTQLRRACRSVRLLEGHSQFAESFEVVRPALESNPLLGHAWKEFCETLILPTDQAAPRIKNTRRPEEYFNNSVLVDAGLNLRLYEAIPNYFVGIGLLLTFVGLVAAISFASEGVVAPDITIAKEALRKLLGAATFKFLTSIAGLIASIWFSYTKKRYIQGFDRLLHRFCRLLEERMDYVSQEKLASEQLEEQKRQTTQLEKFNTDLAVSIAQDFDSSLKNRLTEALEPLAAAMQGLSGNLGTMNQAAIAKMIAEFTKHLETSVSQEIKEVVEGLGAVRKTFDGMLDQIKSGGADFTGSVTEAASHLTKS